MRGQIRIKLGEARLYDSGLSQRLTKQPDGFGIGKALMQIEPSKPHACEAVADLIFHWFIRQVIEGLSPQAVEHENRIKRWPASLYSLGATQALLQRLAKAGPGDRLGEGF